MRQATLYSTDKRVVNVHSGYIPYHVREPIRSLNSYDIFDMKEVRHVHHLPVERWVLNDVEFFVAFDPVLRELIDSKVYAAAQSSTAKAMQTYVHNIALLENDIKRLQSYTVWDMIKLKVLKCLISLKLV